MDNNEVIGIYRIGVPLDGEPWNNLLKDIGKDSDLYPICLSVQTGKVFLRGTEKDYNKFRSLVEKGDYGISPDDISVDFDDDLSIGNKKAVQKNAVEKKDYVKKAKKPIKYSKDPDIFLCCSLREKRPTPVVRKRSVTYVRGVSSEAISAVERALYGVSKHITTSVNINEGDHKFWFTTRAKRVPDEIRKGVEEYKSKIRKK